MAMMIHERERERENENENENGDQLTSQGPYQKQRYREKNLIVRTSMATPSATSSPAAPPLPSLTDSLFQRSLDDLIKSLRSDASAEPAAISRFLAEIRREIRSPDASTKSIALQKLTYLSSLHFLSMSWACFHCLELLPSASPQIKRIAYLAACLSFHPSSTDLLPLSTHQLHKDLTSLPSSSSPSLPLHFLSLASSPDLAIHLAPDLVPLLSRSPPLQCKAIAATFRVLSLCPSTVPVLFKPLVDCLSSENPNTASAAVGAFCELSAPPNDPSPYLPLAPELYKVLINSRSNWTLIKALKIFARLAQIEPRLAARIADPVCQLMRRSSAKSLVFECIRTVILGLSGHDESMRLAIDKLKEFLSSDDDPNLRYLGLQALGMLGPQHSWAVEDSWQVVARSLTDPDRNISREALHLMLRLTVQSNSIEICSLLVKQASQSDPDFANEILGSVLSACGTDLYELVPDFDWYVLLLADMARNPHCQRGDEIGRQLADIGLRVRDARPELVRVTRDLLIDPVLLGNCYLFTVLSASAWISGEYVKFSRDPVELIESLVQPRTSLLPGSVRAVYIQAIYKVLSFSLISYIERLGFIERDDSETEDSLIDTVQRKKDVFSIESVLYMVDLVERTVGPLGETDDVEIQERARNILGFIQLLGDIRVLKRDENSELTKVVKLMHEVFSDELAPVSLNAQKRVPVPEGLDLKENLADLAEFVNDEIAPPAASSISFYRKNEIKEDEPVILTESTSLLTEHRKRYGLYYLPSERESKEQENYPIVNDPLLPINGDTSNNEPGARKGKTVKSRPTVVKLDEGEDIVTSSSPLVKEMVRKDDPLSSAIRNVLTGSVEQDGSSSRRGRRNGSKGKDREKGRERSPRKIEERESKGHRKHKNRKRGGLTVSADPQVPIIQDFLL